VEGLVTLTILSVHDLEDVDFAIERGISWPADYQRPVTAFAFLKRGIECDTEPQNSSHHDSKGEYCERRDLVNDFEEEPTAVNWSRLTGNCTNRVPI
jgi:hypothetical protein